MKNVAKTLPQIVEMATFPGQDPDFLRFGSFPLNGCRGFAGDIVDDAVDAADLIDDAGRDAVEDIVRDARPIGRHEVGGRDAAQRQRIDVLVGAVLAHALREHAVDTLLVLVVVPGPHRLGIPFAGGVQQQRFAVGRSHHDGERVGYELVFGDLVE